MKIALFQMDLLWENPEANLISIEKKLTSLEKGTDIVILPEMFTTGFSMNTAELSENMQGNTLVWMQKMAEMYDILLCGSLIIAENGQYFNRFVAVSSAGILAKYDKKHLFSIAEENYFYSAGQKKILFEYKNWKICPLICYDLRFPIWSRNHFDADGNAEYDLLLYVANWPERRVLHWEKLLQARAIENQSYTIGVNRVGADGKGISYTGSSIAVDFLGNVMCENKVGEEHILYAHLAKNELDTYREKFPAWKDAD